MSWAVPTENKHSSFVKREMYKGRSPHRRSSCRSTPSSSGSCRTFSAERGAQRMEEDENKFCRPYRVRYCLYLLPKESVQSSVAASRDSNGSPPGAYYFFYSHSLSSSLPPFRPPPVVPSPSGPPQNTGTRRLKGRDGNHTSPLWPRRKGNRQKGSTHGCKGSGEVDGRREEGGMDGKSLSSSVLVRIGRRQLKQLYPTFILPSPNCSVRPLYPVMSPTSLLSYVFPRLVPISLAIYPVQDGGTRTRGVEGEASPFLPRKSGRPDV